MGSAAEHIYLRKQASMALNAAVQQLAERMSGSVDDFEKKSLGDLYLMAAKSYGDELPEFWKVWNEWNTGPEDPAFWGEL